MGAWVILGFALYCVAEWFAASWLASIIGWTGVVLVVLVMVIVGAAVMRRAGFAAARSLRPVQADGVTVMPGRPAAEQVGREVGDAGLVFLAGLFIALPGLITSTLGLILLIPPVRRWARRASGAWLRRRAESAGVVVDARLRSTTVEGVVVREDVPPPPRGEILPGEIVRDPDESGPTA
jgi:UPF0716 protein FxsA